jgi:hypothetical protein
VVDSVGAVTGTVGMACHLSVSSFTVSGTFANPNLVLTLTQASSLSSDRFVGTLQADTIFGQVFGAPMKMTRLAP